MSGEGPAPPRRRRLGLALTLAPLALQALAVVTLGVNTVLWDELSYVDFIRDVYEGRGWWPWLAMQHNEHRIVPTKLVMAPLALLTRWDNRAEMLVSVVLAATIVLGLWRLYRRAGGTDLLRFAPVSWLVCSLAQFENVLYGLMTCHYFTLAGVVWMLVLVSAGGSLALAGAALCALVASFSMLNGLLAWPLGLALLALERRWRAAAAWLALASAAVAVYFHGYEAHAVPEPASASALVRAMEVARYGVELLGGPLAAGSTAWAAVLGTAFAAAAVWLAWRWARNPRRLRRDGAAAALLAFGALSCGSIAVGRYTYAGVPPLQSRYVAYSSLVVVALYLLLARDAERAPAAGAAQRAHAAGLALLAAGLLAANAEGLRGALAWRQESRQQKMVLQTYDQRLPGTPVGIASNPAVAAKTAYLRRHRLGPFIDPLDALVLVRWQEGVTANEVLPGRPIEQTLVCPVDELHDVAVVFTTSGRGKQSHLLVSVWEAGGRLAVRELAGGELRDDGWVRLQLRIAGCRGRQLRVRLESADAIAGDAVTVWTYPRYYEGELRQAEAPQIAGRSLGLALNAFHYGLLRE